MRFEIPAIVWKKYADRYVSANTFYQYTIYQNGLCNYALGKFKQCQSVDDAMDWVENVHYPAQVDKYFKAVS